MLGPSYRSLTRRNQALVATLLGMTAGVAVLAVALAVRPHPDKASAQPSAATSRPVATPTPSIRPVSDGGPPPLDAGVLTYEMKNVSEPNDDVPGSIRMEVPVGWRFKSQGEYKGGFRDPTSTWLIRADGTANARSVDATVDARVAALRKAAKDFTLVERAADTQEAEWNPAGLVFRTLVYAHTLAGDRRLVMDRYISIDGGNRTAVQITVAGRPEDRSGLAALLAHATATIVLSD